MPHEVPDLFSHATEQAYLAKKRMTELYNGIIFPIRFLSFIGRYRVGGRESVVEK